MTTRWLKLVRDGQDAPGRLLMIVIALAVSLSAVVAMLATFTVLRREVPRSFRASNPASARLTVSGGVPENVLHSVRARVDVAMADVSGRTSAQLTLDDGESLPVIVFVVPAFTPGRVAAVHHERGDMQPNNGILIERSALALTRASVGDSVTMVFAAGGRRRLRIAGTVHDPGVAPAWQEQVVYAYATQVTMRALGESVALDQLSVVARDPGAAVPALDAMVHDISDMLAVHGCTVLAVHVPPAREHPHQPQMDAIVAMLLMFSLLGMLLATLLTATVVSGLLAQQVRQLAIMKAIGARTAQLRAMYLVLVCGLGLAAVAIALPAGTIAGRSLVMAVAALLNLRLESVALPWWLFAAVVTLGVLAPALVAALPIQRAAHRTVRQAIDDHGARAAGDDGQLIGRWLSRFRVTDAALALAARNVFRRRTRLLMTAGLLSGAGAVFIAALDLRAAWTHKVDTAMHDRRYDFEVHLQDAAPDTLLARTLRAVPGVDAHEGWNATGAMRELGGASSGIGRVHADGGHGALTFRAAPPATSMIAHRMTAGRWLADVDTNAVVINDMAVQTIFPDVQVGQRISLRINGVVRTLTVIGLMAESLTQATAYVTPSTFAAQTGMNQRTSTVRIRLQERGSDSVTVHARRVAQSLADAGMPVRRVFTSARIGKAQGGHVYILVATLGLLALVMAIVGLVGLTSALGVSVLERTREFGIMRALGASRRVIVRSVIVEGLCIALLSLGPAIIVSRILARIVGGVLASVAQQDLRLSLSLPGLLAWSVGLAIAAAAVSYLPASRAARLTVRDAIAHS